MIPSATGTVQVKTYDGDVWTTTTDNTNGTGNFGTTTVGPGNYISATSAGFFYYLDDIHYNDTDFPGPTQYPFTILNGSSTQLLNVNNNGDDVDPLSYKNGVLLTYLELATLLDGSTFGKKNIAVFADLTGDAAAGQKKISATVNTYNPST